jgi:mRNA deadenylase 3'-5' endonuclease subunit Ccr4
MLDHVFVSKSLAGRSTSCVAHDVYQKAMRKDGHLRQDRPSDHRPLIADFRTGD